MMKSRHWLYNISAELNPTDTQIWLSLYNINAIVKEFSALTKLTTFKQLQEQTAQYSWITQGNIAEIKVPTIRKRAISITACYRCKINPALNSIGLKADRYCENCALFVSRQQTLRSQSSYLEVLDDMNESEWFFWLLRKSYQDISVLQLPKQLETILKGMTCKELAELLYSAEVTLERDIGEVRAQKINEHISQLSAQAHCIAKPQTVFELCQIQEDLIQGQPFLLEKIGV